MSSGGWRLSGSVTVTFSPLVARGTVLVSVSGVPPLVRAIFSVTLMLNSSLSPWLVNETVNAWPAA